MKPPGSTWILLALVLVCAPFAARAHVATVENGKTVFHAITPMFTRRAWADSDFNLQLRVINRPFEQPRPSPEVGFDVEFPSVNWNLFHYGELGFVLPLRINPDSTPNDFRVDYLRFGGKLTPFGDPARAPFVLGLGADVWMRLNLGLDAAAAARAARHSFIRPYVAAMVPVRSARFFPQVESGVWLAAGGEADRRPDWIWIGNAALTYLFQYEQIAPLLEVNASYDSGRKQWGMFICPAVTFASGGAWELGMGAQVPISALELTEREGFRFLLRITFNFREMTLLGAREPWKTP
ncbi:MAG: hypothetical protein GMKNLPBB_00713 [Myxococcota bacterium]|nr:hypothetical protein [Myxococcota bacterium]